MTRATSRRDTDEIRVWTVGHGARQLADFLALLREHGIATLADVRAFPGSRRHPHFGREALAAALSTAGIAYAHIPELGGRRRDAPDSPHAGLRVAAFRAYADHMAGAEFAHGLERLTALAGEAPTAFMCAESLWWQCHRRLIADRLTVDGWEVIHIMGPAKGDTHRLWELARTDGGRLVYDAGMLPLEGIVEKGAGRSSRKMRTREEGTR